MAYRTIVVFLVLLQLVWFFTPWGFAYQNGADSALYWLGFNGVLSSKFVIKLSVGMTLLYLFAYAGVFFFQNWARSLLLGLSCVGGLLIPFYGISVQSGLEAMLGFFVSVSEGAVLGIVYFSEIRKKF